MLKILNERSLNNHLHTNSTNINAFEQKKYMHMSELHSDEIITLLLLQNLVLHEEIIKDKNGI